MKLFLNTEVEVWKNKIRIIDTKETFEINNKDIEIHNYHMYVNYKSDFAGKGYIVFKSMKVEKSKKVSSLVFSASHGCNEAHRVFKDYPQYYLKKIKLKDLKKAYR